MMASVVEDGTPDVQFDALNQSVLSVPFQLVWANRAEKGPKIKNNTRSTGMLMGLRVTFFICWIFLNGCRSNRFKVEMRSISWMYPSGCDQQETLNLHEMEHYTLN